MLNKDNVRELAYVVRVDGIEELPGYDRVESALVGGWHCIVPKGQFRPGSLGIYFEIDSRVPADNPAFAFMEKRNYKVKTQKMCKSISQGLLMHPSDFGWKVIVHPFADVVASIIDTNGEIHTVDDESRFLTKVLKVTYAEAEDNERKGAGPDKYKKMAQRHPDIFKKSWARWFMKRQWGRKLMFVFFGKKKDKRGWPAWVQKTDEERVENMPWILSNKDPWIATEKIDGTSTTFTMKRKRFGKKEFYICSRNVVFDKPDKKCFYETNVYTEMAQKYDIENVLASILDQNPIYEWVTLQGETYGAGIQKRDYGLTEHRFMGFNFITSNEGRWNSVYAAKVMHNYNIPWVPILDENYVLPDTIEELRAFSHGEGSRVDGVIKEGVVFRSQDGSMSFKCVDPEFLMKYHG